MLYKLALLNRNYISLEWALNSPPKPHAFVSLPLQSFSVSAILFATLQELHDRADLISKNIGHLDTASKKYYEEEKNCQTDEEYERVYDKIEKYDEMRNKWTDRQWAVNARIEKVENGEVDTRPADHFDKNIDETETSKPNQGGNNEESGE